MYNSQQWKEEDAYLVMMSVPWAGGMYPDTSAAPTLLG